MLEVFDKQFRLKRQLEKRDDWLKLKEMLAVEHPFTMLCMDDIDANTVQASSYLFVPIHQKNHWSLLIVDLLRRKFIHLDSMWPPGSISRADRVVSICMLTRMNHNCGNRFSCG